MPHVIIKLWIIMLWPGMSEQQKHKLAKQVTMAVMDTLHDGSELGVGRL